MLWVLSAGGGGRRRAGGARGRVPARAAGAGAAAGRRAARARRPGRRADARRRHARAAGPQVGPCHTAFTLLSVPAWHACHASGTGSAQRDVL